MKRASPQFTQQFFAVLVACAAAHATAMTPSTDLPPAETFFQDREIASISLSPDGTKALATMPTPGERSKLVIVDLATMKPTGLAGYVDADVGHAAWLSDKRISYRLANLAVRKSDGRATMFAINIDGSQPEPLAQTMERPRSFASSCSGCDQSDYQILTPFPGKTDDMFVIAVYDDKKEVSRLNTRNGVTSRLVAPPGTITWLFDDTGTLRIVITQQGTQHTLQFRESDGSWRKVASFPGGGAKSIRPVLYAGKTLYVHASNDGDKTSLFRYDIARAELESEPLVTSPDYSLIGHFVTDEKKPLGYRYTIDAPETVWFDQRMKTIQEEINALFPSTNNHISRASRGDSPFILVQSSSPAQPGIYRIYHRDTKVVSSLGRALPNVDPLKTAAAEMIHYKARDGLSIPAMITKPSGPPLKNLPTIILVKNHPWARDGVWDWNAEAQFLASRGYAVISPQSRGTGGFGWAHHTAGYKQWGLKMQDDLADGAKWAIEQGIADPKRICIAGSGYGGYAALMGVVKDGGLFRCAINWSGIVDLEKTVSRYGQELGTPADLRERIGDPRADAAQLAATSPLRQALRIKNPVFLAYGAQDVEVPAAHGRALYDAIKPGNPDAEFHLFDEKGQAPLAKNRAALWTKIEQFLEKHNGKR